MGWVMARNPSGLTDHVGFWLRMVSNHVSHSFAARLAQAARGIACLWEGRLPAAWLVSPDASCGSSRG